LQTPREIWEVLGGQGEPPACLGRHAGPLLILGGGRTVWTDYDQVRPWKGEIMAVNDVGQFLHEIIKHWVTLHPEYMPGWTHYRTKHNYGQGQVPLIHSHKTRRHREEHGVNHYWPGAEVGATSGCFGVLVGLMLGYTEIVLAGIPMDNSGHFFDPPWYSTDNEDKTVHTQWRWARDNVFQGRVRSLSGYTRQWLGAPQTNFDRVNKLA
jgi:hypothetical protein